MKRKWLVLLGVVFLVLCIAFPCSAVVLPVFSDFNADTLGGPPATGGANQPTSLEVPVTGSITVASHSMGIDSPHVELYDGGPSQYTSAFYDFPVVTSGILRVEATISVDNYRSGYLLQTIDPDLVMSRLLMSEAGKIEGRGKIEVGTYTPNIPFRVRMDVDIDNGVWSAVIDNELDGFGDDSIIGGISFSNDPSMLAGIGRVAACLNMYSSQDATTMAYDDITITVIPEPATLLLLGLGGLMLRKRRRM